MSTQAITKNDPKTIFSWSMYDWANSSYALVITSAIFPAYYNEATRWDGSDRVHVLGVDIENTAAYSIALGLAFGTVALVSPLVSSVADYAGIHKRFMQFFCYLGASGCAMLFFLYRPQHSLGSGRPDRCDDRLLR